MHLSLHRRMREAVLIINNHAEYLAKQVKKLGYKVFYIDNYNPNNLEKILKKNFLHSFIKKIRKHYNLIKLIYGSGLEDKQGIYKVLRTETDIQGNDLEVLDFCNNILNLEKALNISGLQIPKTSIKPLPSKSKSIIKPLFSSGGLNISFYKKDKNNFYYQEFIPGPTFSISFFIKKKKFFLLGYNRLFTLKNFITNPFIHAGAMKISKNKKFNQIHNAVEIFSSIIGLKGYNNIDFKIFNNKAYVLDINPRITSTFKIYNELYINNLLKAQINLTSNKTKEIYNHSKRFYGFVHMFSKKNFKFYNRVQDDSSITNLPFEGEAIKKHHPIFTLNYSSNSPSSIINLLKKKISMTTQYYNCYDIDI